VSATSFGYRFYLPLKGQPEQKEDELGWSERAQQDASAHSGEEHIRGSLP